LAGKRRSIVSAETSRRLFLKTVVFAGLGLVVPGVMPQRGEAAFRVGDVPPTVTLNDLKGTAVIVPSGFKGKIALIHFWASWCPTCRGEMTALESIYGKYGVKGVIPCSIGIGEKKETIISYLKSMTLSYPVLIDPSSSTVKPFGVAGVPTYYILDRKSVIRYRILGEANKEGLDKIIRALL
jgi:cytochrome c biogenesis protein CcmG/thiol:disulfide interchange protein DsbE